MTPAATVLTKKQLRSVLLKRGDLADEFVVASDDGDDGPDDVDLGCLDDVFDEDVVEGDGGGSATAAKSGFVREGVQVDSEVESYTKASIIVDEFAAVVAGLNECSKVDVTNEGARFVLDVKFNEAVTNDAADQQLNLTISGTARGPRGSVPFAITAVITRVENNLASVSFVGIFEDQPETRTALQTLSNVVVNRLDKTTRAGSGAGD